VVRATSLFDVVFADGVSWVARIRLPVSAWLQLVNDALRRAQNDIAVNEIETMRYVPIYPFRYFSTNGMADNPFLDWELLTRYSNDYNAAYPHSLNVAPNETNGLAVPYDPATLQLYNPWAVFVQSYSCTAMVRKTPISILVVMVSGLYALIMGAKGALATVLTWYYKRGNGDQGIRRPFLLSTANQRSKLLRGLCC
jgi:hypothetical protein